MATSSQSESESLRSVSPLESSSSSISTETPRVVSLLDRLKSPTSADLSRKRKTPTNPPKGLKRAKGSIASEPLQEEDKVRGEIKERHVSVIFDGTTHVCEATVIVLRFVDNDWCIQQRVARLMLLAKSMSGEELARQLILCLSTELGITGDRLLASIHDRASVNNVAMQTLKVIYPDVVDIGCFSHTLDLVGEKFCTPILDQFFKGWINMFSRSPKTKLTWRSKTGLPVPTYSTTRWRSKWEVLKHMLGYFGDIPSFLQDKDLPLTRLKLLEIINDPPRNRKLRMELAVTIDAGEPFVKATYRLEGDGLLIFSVYEEISNVRATVSNEYYPNVSAVANSLAGGPVSSHSDMLVNYAKSCVKPVYKYFEKKFTEDLAIPLSIFKRARIFDPSIVVDLRPTTGDIDDLCIFPFLKSDSIIHELKSELPRYIATAEGVSSTVDKRDWWKRNCEALPVWSKACKSVLLLQPSSAAAERVFSILSNSFNNRQQHSLKDYIEASVMLQYNSR